MQSTLLKPHVNSWHPCRFVFSAILWIDQLIETEGHKLLGKADKLTEDQEDPFQLLGRQERTRSDTPKVC